VIRLQWHVCALFGGLALASLSGCGLVVGAGDYKVGNTGDGSTVSEASTGSGSGASSGSGSGASSGAPGEDGSPPGDDATAPPEDASSGSSSGTSSGSTSGGDAGEGGVTPPVDSGVPPVCGSTLPAASSPDFTALVAACVIAVNCDPAFFDVNMSDCISNDYLQSFPATTTAVQCLSTATNCAGYYACVGQRAATPAECSGTVASGSCSGTAAKTCFISDFSGSIQNCTKLGGTCGVHTNDNGDQAADCKVVATCSDTDELLHCSGTKLYECFGTAGYGQDCANINATCKDIGNGPQCVFNAAACSVTGTKCTGNDITDCTSGKQALDEKCGRAGGACVEDTGSSVCVAPGCDPPSTTACLEGCENDNITADICVGGKKLAIDCSKYGFTACTTLSDPNSVNDSAFCF
jgi:hypothetical protein